MIPNGLASVTFEKFPTHTTEHHSWLIIQHRLRTELTSSARLAVGGRFIPPGCLVFSLPSSSPKDPAP